MFGPNRLLLVVHVDIRSYIALEFYFYRPEAWHAVLGYQHCITPPLTSPGNERKPINPLTPAIVLNFRLLQHPTIGDKM